MAKKNEEQTAEDIKSTAKAADNAEAKTEDAKPAEEAKAETENMEAEEAEENAEENADAEAAEGNEKKGFFSKKKPDKKSEKITELEERVKQLEDEKLRILAEYKNYMNRTEREMPARFAMGASSVIEKIIPVIDNFERGFDTLSEEQKQDPFAVGMDKVYQQLMTELSNIGVTPIEAVGQEFNPELHNAIMQVQSEEFESGIIAQELMKGYKYKDSVVRHSMVAVVE